MTEKGDYDGFVRDRGIVLTGVGDFLLTTNDALAAVRLAEDAGIPILGGDVYVRQSGTIVPAYANWHVDRKPGESLHEFAQRTWKEADAYLRAYPEPRDGDPLFALVIWSSGLPGTGP
jgi:hypothetical protein